MFREEEWKIIPEFPRFEVSNLGRVRNADTHEISKVYERPNGFTQVHFYENYQIKARSLAKLVAEAFLPPAPTDAIYVIAYKDGNHHNYRADNLYWINRAENLTNIRMAKQRKKGGETMSRPKTRRAVVCVETNELFPTIQAAADEVGVSQSGISKVLLGVNATAGGYTWKYATERDTEFSERLEEFEEILS